MEVIIMVNIYNNQSLGLGSGVPITPTNSTGGDSKLSEDRYEIYVNGDFVGYKTLFNVSDYLSDVDNFIKSQGNIEFKSQLDGDHYNIQTEESERIKEILDVYCQNR
jgi:hypothetical protein